MHISKLQNKDYLSAVKTDSIRNLYYLNNTKRKKKSSIHFSVNFFGELNKHPHFNLLIAMCIDVNMFFYTSHLAKVDTNLFLKCFPLSIFQVGRH